MTASDPVSGSTVGSLAPTSGQPRPESAPVPSAVLGYVSVDAGHPEYGDHVLRRQMREIVYECERRGLRLVQVVNDRVPPRQASLERPGLAYALHRIADGAAKGLVVSELSQLSHGLPDLGRVLEWLTGRHVRLVVATPNIDTWEEAGSLAVATIIEVSGWERQRLAERTRAGMRAARRKGPARVSDDPALQDRIARMRASGMTLQGIANRLNADGIPTLRGGAMWRPSSVQAAAGYRRPPTTSAGDPDHGSPGEPGLTGT